MNRRKRRYSSEPKKPFSTKAYVAAGIAGASLVVCLGMLIWSISVAGNTTVWAGGVGFLSMLIAMVCFFTGAGVFRNQTYNKQSRLMGMIIPSVAFLVWIGIYVAGLVIG